MTDRDAEQIGYLVGIWPDEMSTKDPAALLFLVDCHGP